MNKILTALAVCLLVAACSMSPDAQAAHDNVEAQRVSNASDRANLEADGALTPELAAAFAEQDAALAAAQDDIRTQDQDRQVMGWIGVGGSLLATILGIKGNTGSSRSAPQIGALETRLNDAETALGRLQGYLDAGRTALQTPLPLYTQPPPPA